MDAMDLEKLPNEQLRQKCLEYGLPDVPVTHSTRKVLTIRLNAVMNRTTPQKSSTPKASTPCNRRKSVHASTTVATCKEDDFLIKTQRKGYGDTLRRQTVAPVPKESPPKPRPIAPRPVKERITPIDFESAANSARVGETNGPSANANDRQRRSVRLSKTGVLKTSYSTETSKVPLRATYEQDMKEDEYEEPEGDLCDIEMESAEKVEAPKIYTHPSCSGYNQATSYNAATYRSPTFAVLAPPQAPVNKLYPDLPNSGLQSDFYNRFDGVRANHSSSARHSNLGFTRNTPTSYVPVPQPLSSGGMDRQTIAGSSSYVNGGISDTAPICQSDLTSSSKRYSTSSAAKRHTARAIHNDEPAASSSADHYETPCLSEFSRNLENLQPEPIYKRTSSAQNYSSVGPKRRRATYKNEEGATFGQLWTALKQKYHLKAAFYFMLFFVITAFIYVFFLQ